MMGLDNIQINSLRTHGYYIDAIFKDSSIHLTAHFEKGRFTPEEEQQLVAYYRDLMNRQVQMMLQRPHLFSSTQEEEEQINTEYINDRGNK